MEYFLVRFRDNWADEMDINGFSVMSANEWQRYQADAKTGHYPRTMCIGTNEELDWESVENFLYCFKPVPITKEEADVFRKLSLTEFGVFPEAVGYYDEDEDEEWDEDEE